MAAFSLDGEKICEVSGQVKWSSVERFSKGFEAGSIALYKLSSNYYVHAITTAKRAKFPLLKLGKIDAKSRDSRLMLSLSQGSTKNSGTVCIHLKEAVQSQLQLFLDHLNGVEAYFSTFKGKLSSLPSRDNDIQDIENQPCNVNTSSVTSNRGHKYESSMRSNLVSTSSSHNSPNDTPNRPPNYFAKQMNPPSSYNSQNKKTPLHDQTRARDNLNNTFISSSSRSASSFYGSRNSWSPSESNRFSSTGKALGPGLMPPPRPWSQTSRLVSQISFRSREKRPFEKEVTLTGFSNLGNTCYMNAILQSLLGIPPFVQDLSSKSLLDQVHPQCLYRCLYNVLVCKRKCGNAEILRNSLRKLKRTISEAATRFSGYHQHDAHEFLCQVFDQLRDDVNSCNSPPSKSTSQEINSKTKELHCPVTRSFESGVLHTISCKQCGECAPKEEIYHAFSLDIPSLCNSASPSGAINMQTLIKKHFEDEELEYTCSKCDSKEAIISHSFSRLPRVLILHLKRYGYDNLTEEQEKKQDRVNIERFIAIEMLCSSKTKAPLPFEYKPSLKLTPLKSRQKPQKRHFISEDDDDDDDFRPSPSVRRKLDHSFSTTVTSRSAQESFPDPKVNSEDDLEITGTFKLDKIDESNTGVDDANDKDFLEGKMDSHGSNVDGHLLRSKKPVWEGTEEEQMEWALSESAKSAEKKFEEKKVNDTQLDCTGKSDFTVARPLEDPSLQRKRKSEVDAKITAECNSNGDVTATEKKCVQNNLNVYEGESEMPIWDGTEEEQLTWALAESAKLSTKKKSRDNSEKEKEENPRERTRKSQSPTSVFEDNDFVLLSDLSDEDLARAAQECDTDGPNGLKGGGPIATDRCHDIAGVDSVSDVYVVNDENSKPQNCEDSGLEKNTAKSFLLKNSPIICVKRKNGHLQRKRRTLGGDVFNKTPSLEKFEGNLFADEPRENKVATYGANPSSENKVSTNSATPSNGTGSSWFKSSFSKFNDEDMEKAISMSLQDQQMSNVEDEDLKRALELSLQEFEGKQQPTFPANIGVANLESVTDSAPQDEGCKVSTHSYRLVSIVSHLGSSSTSGHYISDVYDCNTKQWTSYDDSTATKLTEHGVRYKRQQSGYIFFYLYKQCVDAIENSSPSKENSQR